MERLLRVEVIIRRLLRLDIYVREMMEVNLKKMTRVKYHSHKTILIDTESSSFCTSDEEEANAADDCEHLDCHKIKCKLKNTTA